MSKSEIRCYDCDEKLTENEIGNYSDRDGNQLCVYCYSEHIEENSFQCVMCEDLEDNEYAGSIGSLIVVIAENDSSTPVGTYEILKHPFCRFDHISTKFYKKAIKQLSIETWNLDEDAGCIAEYLCRVCSERIKKKITEEGVVQ